MRPVRVPAAVLVAALLAVSLGFARESDVLTPVAQDSVRFLVLGDAGTGDRYQRETAADIVRARERFPFTFAIMPGDNLYGSERPQDYARKFEEPYAPLLGAGIRFYAALGNHDDPNQRFYEGFNMNGQRHYTFTKSFVRFFALDSNYMDEDQLRWLERELARSNDRWKIAFFHHPLYSSGERHGSEVDLRVRLEPILVKGGVDVVVAGHEHFYERVKPQKGIYYFTSGGTSKLRRGNIRPGPLTAAGFDQDRSFLLMEVAEDALHFQAIARGGKRVDSGSLPRPADVQTSAGGGAR